MKTGFWFPIRAIVPPSPAADEPPSSLTQALAWSAKRSTHTCRWHVPQKGFDGKLLCARLAAMADRHQTTRFICPDAIRLDRLMALLRVLETNPSALRLSMSCAIPGDAEPIDQGPPAHIDNIIEIQWRLADNPPELTFFKRFSDRGIWNHLVIGAPIVSRGTIRKIADQPNIVHSWEMMPGTALEDHFKPSYGAVPPLPGRPLWRALADPTDRFLILDRFGSAWLAFSRVAESEDRLYRIGESLAYHYCPPERLPPGYLDDICAMVAAGGTVAATYVRSNLERAFLVGYVCENGVLVGNSSLKNPRPEYIEAVRRQSGLDLTGFVERGYTSVRPEYRGLGIGTKLLEGLTARAGDRKLFSIIAEDNLATQTIAIRNRTRKVATYFSRKAGKRVGVWMPVRTSEPPDSEVVG